MKLYYRGFQILPQVVENKQVWLATCRNYSRNFNRLCDATNEINRILAQTEAKSQVQP